MSVADDIRAREKLSATDGLVLTLLDVLAERDHLAQLLAVKPLVPELRGGLLHMACPHCGRDL